MEDAVKTLVEAENKKEGLQRLNRLLEDKAELAEKVWNAFGVAIILLSEITNMYKTIGAAEPSFATATLSLSILQKLCRNKRVREKCISTQFPLYLYPILNSTVKTAAVEKIKVESLLVISAILEDEDPGVIEFVKNTELVPLCLKNMEMGEEKTKLVAIKIFHTILSDKEGLEYVCQTYDRFMATSMVLTSMLSQLEELKSEALLVQILKVYLRLCDMENARVAFGKNKPIVLFSEGAKELAETKEVKKLIEKFNAVLKKSDPAQVNKP